MIQRTTRVTSIDKANSTVVSNSRNLNILLGLAGSRRPRNGSRCHRQIPHPQRSEVRDGQNQAQAARLQERPEHGRRGRTAHRHARNEPHPHRRPQPGRTPPGPEERTSQFVQARSADRQACSVRGMEGTAGSEGATTRQCYRVLEGGILIARFCGLFLH